MGLWRSILGQGIEVAAELAMAAEIGSMAFEEALGMTGNPGQVSIIENMTEGVFVAAATNTYGGHGDAESFLFGACAYPDAVDAILYEAAAMIEDEVTALQEM